MLPTITTRAFRPFYMPNFFDEDIFTGLSGRTASIPAVNVREDENNYALEFAIPGIEKDFLKIDINEDVLSISSETRNESEEKKDGYRRKEFSYSSFCRKFYIPENVNRDKIEATYKDGILKVDLPKQEEETKKITRQIKIS